MRTRIRILQIQELVYQLVGLRRRQPAAAFDCRLAGHGRYPLINNIRIMSRNIVGKPVDHLDQQILLGDGQ